MKYKIEYVFDGYKFIFSSNNKKTLEKQKSHIDEFYIPSNNKTCKKVFNIEVLEDVEVFNKYIKICDGLKGKAYQSFENQIHNEYLYNDNKVYVLDKKEYVCVKKNDTNYLIISDGSEKTVKWPFRVLREILVRLEEDEKKLFMHGTGISKDDKGILFLGGSGSGKTSFVIKTIESKIPIDFYSNDRMFLCKDSNNQIKMNYFPIPIVYAMGTVKNNSDLDKYFKESRILEKRTNKNYELSSFSDKVDVPLVDTLKIFDNVNLKSECCTNLIIFPKMIKTLQDENPKLINLNNNLKRVFLEQTCFTPYDWESFRYPWIYQRKSSMEEIIFEKYDTINKIIDNTEIVGLEYGFNVNPKKLIKEITRRI